MPRLPLILTLLLPFAALAQVSPPSGVTVTMPDGGRYDYALTTRPTTGPATQPAPAPVVARRSLIGVNLDSLLPSSPQHVFIDAMRTARRFGTFARPEDQRANVDADGWPTDADSGVVVFTDQPAADGVYTLVTQRRTQVTLVNSGGSALSDVAETPTGGITAKVTIPPGQGGLWLRFKGGSPGRVKLLRPGYVADDRVFTGDLLRALAPFGTIRFMDYFATNSLLNPTFDGRVEPSHATYATRGGSIEHAVDLCNVTGADFWFNIPVLWTDADVAKGAAIIRDRLRPGLFCYVEYGNELWNVAPAFKPQHDANANAARAEAEAGDGALTAGGTHPNYTYAAWRRVGKRSVQIRRVMGTDERFRVVLASQVGYTNGFVLQKQLEYIAAAHGEPKTFLWGVAGAPYFALPRALQSDASLTPQQYADALYSNHAAVWNANTQSFKRLADQYGLRLLAYEGGIHDVGLASGASMVAGQRLPRTGEAVEAYLNAWQGDVFCYFSLASRWTPTYGVWGLTNNLRDLDAPKYRAAARVATTRRAN